MIALAIINYDYLDSRKHGRGSGSTVRHHVVNAVGLRQQRKKSDNHIPFLPLQFFGEKS
jgi:hypothetical protein